MNDGRAARAGLYFLRVRASGFDANRAIVRVGSPGAEGDGNAPRLLGRSHPSPRQRPAAYLSSRGFAPIMRTSSTCPAPACALLAGTLACTWLERGGSLTALLQTLAIEREIEVDSAQQFGRHSQVVRRWSAKLQSHRGRFFNGSAQGESPQVIASIAPARYGAGAMSFQET